MVRGTVHSAAVALRGRRVVKAAVPADGGGKLEIYQADPVNLHTRARLRLVAKVHLNSAILGDLRQLVAIVHLITFDHRISAFRQRFRCRFATKSRFEADWSKISGTFATSYSRYGAPPLSADWSYSRYGAPPLLADWSCSRYGASPLFADWSCSRYGTPPLMAEIRERSSARRAESGRRSVQRDSAEGWERKERARRRRGGR